MAQARKVSMLELVQDFHRLCGHRLKFISGKWFSFKNGEATEIENMVRYLVFNPDRLPLSGFASVFRSTEDYNNLLSEYIALYSEEGLWPESKAITCGRALKKPRKPLCLPLTQKDLMMINYMIEHHNDGETMFILTGVGGTGKSTLGNLICQIFDNDIGAASLSDLGNIFSVEEAIRHRIVFSDELQSDELNQNNIKKLVSNQVLQVQAKNERPYNTRCQSVFLFSCNNPPRIDVSDTGILRRIVYYYKGPEDVIKNPNPALNRKEFTLDELADVVKAALLVDMTDWKSVFIKDSHRQLLHSNSVYYFLTKADASYTKLKDGTIYRTPRGNSLRTAGISDEQDYYKDYSDFCGLYGFKRVALPKFLEVESTIRQWEADGEL